MSAVVHARVTEQLTRLRLRYVAERLDAMLPPKLPRLEVIDELHGAAAAAAFGLAAAVAVYAAARMAPRPRLSRSQAELAVVAVVGWVVVAAAFTLVTGVVLLIAVLLESRRDGGRSDRNNEPRLGTARIGEGVNLELDMIAKYVRARVAPYRASTPALPTK